jgi:hypothetical protein
MRASQSKWALKQMLRTCSIARRYVQRGPKESVLVLAAGEGLGGRECEGEVVAEEQG